MTARKFDTDAWVFDAGRFDVQCGLKGCEAVSVLVSAIDVDGLVVCVHCCLEHYDDAGTALDAVCRSQT